ncbi:hypothetical protein [Natronobacterium texcoconense]|uniref:Uncharacterized protein n=1 Tax=Natronobacterium texcoconense TaxID=1095778 RepID=A0A1H1FLC2_NATTX|nr:hypothetical protein [Natronobacterium texcoconense]SDR01680.1 hypothetical protein SAMN04489842_2013 [Natronobacterium texcoconense]
MSPPASAALFLLGVWVLVMLAVPCVAAYHQWRWKNGLTSDGYPFPESESVPADDSMPADD